MSTCPECYEDVGCTCQENKRIAELEKENKTLKARLDVLTVSLDNATKNQRKR